MAGVGLPCVCPEPPRGTLPEEYLNHVQNGNLENIHDWVSNGGDINAATEGGQTLLSAACVYRRLDVLEKLLEQPAIHLNTKHRLGALSRFTPLCIAANKGLHEFVSALCKSSGQCRLDVEATTGKGKNALMLAAQKGHWEVVEILCPDLPVPQEDHPIITSLARLAKKPKILQLLQLQQPQERQGESQSIPAFNKVYDNNTSPRGFVFILNYKFENDPQNIREGTDADATKLQSVFKCMNYETEEHKDLSRAQTCNKIQEFCRQDRLKDSSSLIIIVLSHGINRDTFMTADNKLITMNELCTYFTNENCPHMKEKPKIFLLQFCRGSDSAKQVNLIKRKSPSDGIPTDAIRDAFTNMMCIYSAQEGFESYRFEGKPLDPITGTPFIEALYQVLTKKGDLWLDDLVREFMQEYRNNVGGQPMDYHNLNFSKKFCFNPTRQ